MQGDEDRAAFALNVESCFFRLSVAPHSGQAVGMSLVLRTSVSTLAPHVSHLYSKIGMSLLCGFGEPLCQRLFVTISGRAVHGFAVLVEDQMGDTPDTVLFCKVAVFVDIDFGDG